MTFELIPFLKEMLSVPGLSGYEKPVRDVIARAWEPLSDELSLSNLGSLLALKRGEGPDPRPTAMIAVHMDAIGLMVTAIEDGFLRFTQVGGVDPRILPGQPVIVHATKGKEAQDLPALVVMPPAQLLPKEAGTGPWHRPICWLIPACAPKTLKNSFAWAISYLLTRNRKSWLAIPSPDTPWTTARLWLRPRSPWNCLPNVAIFGTWWLMQPCRKKWAASVVF